MIRMRARVYSWVVRSHDKIVSKISTPRRSKRRFAAGDTWRRLSSDSRPGR